MSTRYDAIIIGGGHNGLVCAAYLAKAGRKVLVLERRPVLGGAAVTEELHPGFKYTVCSYVVSLMRPWIVRELELARCGLQLIPLECSFTPHLEGPGLCRWPDPQRTREEIAGLSVADAEQYPRFGQAMGRLARFVKDVIDQPAPDPASLWPSDLGQLARHARAFQQLSSADALNQIKLATMSAADLLDEWFESDALKAPMSCSGIIGTFLGVRSPGTAAVLLHHYMGEIDGASRAWGIARGGNGAVSEAIATAARGFGATIRTQAAVARILVRGGEAAGVVLDSGDEIEAKVVVSAAEPRLTFLRLLGREHLDDDFVARIKRYRCRGSSGKVNLALDRLPSFTCRPGDGLHIRGDIAVAPSIDYLEEAYDEAKYGAFSRRPYLNVVIPSLLDPTLAPPGKHVMSIFVQYAPYALEAGPSAWPSQREAFGDAVVQTLAEYCPGLEASILHRQVLTPWDLEQQFGLTEGNIFHGELTADQLLFQRPLAGWARYRSPVPGLWMCASGTHPGGGVMGAPGGLAAKAILSAAVV
ncbi:MAG TPA: NAD(P)/FAD-dependent oxidoreductase [Deltaproteobacteria bacterium]|nr:NAD(P)/FAD-dependent oxidoreductase [Deltaproteobacteria bacterium]